MASGVFSRIVLSICNHLFN